MFSKIFTSGFLVLASSLILSCTTLKKEALEPVPLSLQDYENQSRKEIMDEIETYFKILEMGFTQGRPLGPEELTYARFLGIRDPEGLRVLEYDRIPVLFERDRKQLQMMGINLSQFDPNGAAFPRTIMIRKGNHEKMKTLVHELVHVKQGQDLGLIKADGLINYEYATFGYEDSPLEIQARDMAEELVK